MSTEVGNNKRVVQKQKKTVKTANIKVSTADKDIVSSQNKSTEKGPNKNKIGKNGITDKMEQNIFQQTKELEEKLKKLQEDKKNSESTDFEKLKKKNKELSDLDKDYKNAYKTNYSLISKLKDMQNDLTKEFDNKFKMSNIIYKQKKSDYESNLNIQIKAKEMEIEIEEKKGKVIQKQYERLEKLEKSGKEKTLKKELEEYKEKIKGCEKDIKELKEKEKEFKKNKVEKNNEKLEREFKALQNSQEFEVRKKEQEEEKEKEKNSEQRKKKREEIKKRLEEKKKENEKKKINIEEREKYGRREKFVKGVEVDNKLPLIERMKEYGKNLRKEELNDVEDFDGKKNIKVKKIWDNFSKELKDNLEENSLTSRQDKMSKSGNLRTSGNVAQMFSSYKSYQAYLKKINGKVDISTPKVHIFSKKEEEVIHKYMPKFMEDLNNRYKGIEEEIDKNRKEMELKKQETNNVKNSKKLEIDFAKIDGKKEELIKRERKMKINENIKKIYNLRKEIYKINQMIKDKEKIISKAKKNNGILKRIILEIKQLKEQEKQNQEKNEDEGEEGEGEEGEEEGGVEAQ